MYKKMGVDFHSRRPSPEALLRRVALGKGLYAINTCVDAYNLVVMKYRISLGAFDADHMTLPCEVKVAGGGETIDLLGVDGVTTLKKGEVIYCDQIGPYNLDYNYRDAERTKITEQTKISLSTLMAFMISMSKKLKFRLKKLLQGLPNTVGAMLLRRELLKQTGNIFYSRALPKNIPIENGRLLLL